MKLYLLTQYENSGYDTYDSIIVAAKNEDDARSIHPYDGDWESDFSPWASKPENVTVKLIGTAVKGTPRGVILASFNAG